MPQDQKTNLIDLLIPVVALVLLTWRIGSYGLYEPHEAHFALVGNEMVWRNDWITPYLNGAPYLNKPPLLYWLIAGSQTLFTSTEWAARLPVALAAWLGLIVAGIWSKQLWGTMAYRCTCLLLAVTMGWFIFAHQILIDVVLATLLLASNFFLWKLLQKPRSWLYFWAFYSCVALSFLAKGFIGLCLIGICYIAIALYNRPLLILRQTKLLLGIIWATALVMPWCWAIEQANPGFWQYFIFNEHLARIFDRRIPPDYVVSQTSVLGYLLATALWCFPWSLFLPSVLWFIWQKLSFSFKKEKTPEQNAVLLLTLGFILPIVVFLPLESRLIYYSISAIPSYAILTSGVFCSLVAKPYRLNYRQHRKATRHSRLLFNSYGAVFIFCGILGLTAIAMFPRLLSLLMAERLQSVFTSFAIAILGTLTLGCLFAGIELLKNNYRLSFNYFVVSLFVLYSLIPVAFSFYQPIRSSRSLMVEARKYLPNNTLWIFEGSREIGAAAGLSYYFNLGQAPFTFTPPDTAQEASQLPGIVLGKDDTYYFNVLVLQDGGANRLPPQFPGKKPDYLIDKQQLQSHWDSDRPTVFITDFLRDNNDPSDPIEANLPDNSGESIIKGSNRRLYLNQAARQSVLRRRNPFY